MIPRPMLASNEVVEDFDSLTYPLIASPKIDAWRSYNFEGEPRTRSGKTIPNEFVRLELALPELEGLDGELVCGSPTDPNAMQQAQSAFSTHSGSPEFTWYIFDDLSRGTSGYWSWMCSRLRLRAFPAFCRLVPQHVITSAAELEIFKREILAQGYEGVVTRAPASPYKHNRSTRKQEWMLKIKEYTYEEAWLVGLNEKMENCNTPVLSELGFTKRSGHQDGKVGTGTLGSFTLRRPGSQVTFKVGCGHLDATERQDIWDRYHMDPSSQFVMHTHPITFKHFARTGVVNKPRQGQFVSFRALEDL